MALNIAILGIYHESNTFIQTPTTLADFEKGHWFHADQILDEYRHSFHEIGGMIAELEAHDVNIVPVFFAEATPGGIIAADVSDALIEQMFNSLDKCGPVDGCLAVVHGAAVSENHRDLDGYWLSLLRERMGADLPIVGTLDPHANVSQRMVESTNILVSYSTNPHTDQFNTGKKAAAFLMQMIRTEIDPVQQLFSSPAAISIEQQYTGANPCRALYQFAEELRSNGHLLHISINLGFPYADVNEMGTSFIVVANKPGQAITETGAKLCTYMDENRMNFIGSKMDPESLPAKIRNAERPVLLLDMGDNVGGGAPGNSTCLFKIFDANSEYRFFISLYDPAAVHNCYEHEINDHFELSLTDDQLQQPLVVKVRLIQKCRGNFTEAEPRHGGQVHYDMGNIAEVETETGNTILLMSNRIPPFSLRQLTSFDINPANYDLVVAKGVIAPIAAYQSVCKTIIQVDTPGTTRADMTAFEYKYRRRPLFPFEG